VRADVDFNLVSPLVRPVYRSRAGAGWAQTPALSVEGPYRINEGQ